MSTYSKVHPPSSNSGLVGVKERPMPEGFSRRRFLVQGGKVLLAGGATVTAGPLLSACDWFAKSGPTSTTEVSYTYPTFTPVPDSALVQDAMNKILKPKYGVTIKLNPIDDLLHKYAPKTYASMTVQSWQATKVNGKIYGVLNQQPWTRPIGPRVRKDLADKYGLDLTKVNTFDDLTPFLAAVKAGEPKVTPIGIAQIADKGGPYSAALLGYEIVDGVSTDAGVIGVKADDANLKVVNIATLPEFQKQVQLARQWFQAGYYPVDPPGEQATANWRAGQYAVEIDVVHRDSTGQLKATYGFDFVAKGLGPLVLTTGGIIATMNNISSTSKHPEAAMTLLEALNTDVEVYRLICRGIEGTHYVVTDAKNAVVGFPSGVTPSNDRYNPQTSWMFGDLFNDFYSSEDTVGAWPLSLKDNQTAIPSKALGFAFDPTNVKTELAQVQKAQQQYGYPLIMGRANPSSGLSNYLSKLKDAGVDKVISEIQHQLDTWKASK